ncbi:MAG: hypothetical protein RLZ98_3383 [Pseudomonadota bacterium]
MRVLVTRPEEDAKALKAHLVSQGHEVVIEPLISVTYEDTDEIELDEAQALVATSRNALRAIAQSADADLALQLPLFVVGPGTAGIAKALGFANVVEGPGNAAALLDVIAERAEVNAGPIVYLSGDVRAYELPSELQRLGFRVMSPVVYRTRPATALSPQVLEKLQSGAIDAVLLLSPRTAQTWLKVVDNHNILELVAKLCHICLSESVARQLAPLACRDIRIAERPNLREILALLTS